MAPEGHSAPEELPECERSEEDGRDAPILVWNGLVARAAQTDSDLAQDAEVSLSDSSDTY